ncbi:olfactory receptor 9I1 isoform X1 [Canis lupus familiaris]|uniref:olfactory receptor 9I1 isoform X1 n=1 Tax=Canis lupus familiaris TaxID=9615 RepID=UPI0018F31AB9|nr:olfactory receptor 9I1 isoform X1 [Canis lupus familiaris]XP_038280193.1 olfactory receptor 9I1 isoform X1 [Canis lupus familiaris]
MEKNGTMVTEFILLGFQLPAELQMGLFLVFLVLYFITLVGNLGMIVLIQRDPRLQTPMYFFLCHLSFLDICYSSVIVPQFLETLGTDKMAITYECCATQFFFFTLCASTECFLLAVMAYDRYVAVCNPLLYATAMTPQTCLGLVTGAYAGAMVNAVIRTGCTFSISFCYSEDSYSRWQSQDFLHLCLSHDRSSSFLWDTHIHIPESLRNKEVKEALKKAFNGMKVSQAD